MSGKDALAAVMTATEAAQRSNVAKVTVIQVF